MRRAMLFAVVGLLVVSASAQAWQSDLKVTGSLNQRDQAKIAHVMKLADEYGDASPLRKTKLEDGSEALYYQHNLIRLKRVSDDTECLTVYGSGAIRCTQGDKVKACVDQPDGTNHCDNLDRSAE